MFPALTTTTPSPFLPKTPPNLDPDPNPGTDPDLEAHLNPEFNPGSNGGTNPYSYPDLNLRPNPSSNPDPDPQHLRPAFNCRCGHSNSWSKILGGVFARPNVYPWQVALVTE